MTLCGVSCSSSPSCSSALLMPSGGAPLLPMARACPQQVRKCAPVSVGSSRDMQIILSDRMLRCLCCAMSMATTSSNAPCFTA